ncbi:MAG: M56 family metallopeptidase [Chloroflexota bacterium]|nr:M56 family metallopeptidase [Chloroflexota bacterium]MDE3192832.1 M56 family metallopeptidase [Chloroflexota bacterium]
MLRGERAFGVLILLGLVSSLVLGGVLAVLVPRAVVLATHGAGGPRDVVSILLIGLAALGITLGLSSLLRQLFATLRLIHRLLARRVETPERVDIAAGGLDLAGRIDVVDDERPFSFCYWFLRPRICLSTALVGRLGRDELRAVLLHERYHLVHRDPLRLVIARYLAAGLYVVPMVEDLVEHFTLEKELEADGHAVSRIGVAPLARALYELLPDADSVSLGLLVPVGALSVTEARIDHLVEGRPLEMRVSPASVALSFGALTAAAILAAAQAPAPAQLPPVLAVPGLLVAPASLLFVAAVSGGVEQLRLVVHR